MAQVSCSDFLIRKSPSEFFSQFSNATLVSNNRPILYCTLPNTHVYIYVYHFNPGDFYNLVSTLPLCLCKHCAGFTSSVMCHL